MAGEHQVLEEEVSLIVGAQRVTGAERHDIVGIDETVGRAVDTADRLVGDFGSKPEMAADPGLPVGPAARAETLPVIDHDRPLTVRLGQDDQQDVDVLPRAVDDRQEDRRSRALENCLFQPM